MGRPTLKDVAKEAGLSIATVNRVVAGAPGVRADTARKVADAAFRIGYHGRTMISERALEALPEIRMGFLLQKEKQTFYQDFAEEIRRACSNVKGFRIVPRVDFSPSQAPGDVVDRMENLARHVDVIAATSVNHHSVTEAVLRLADRGIGCMSLLSDFAQGVRKCYFGLNNLNVGRGVARELAKAASAPGKVGIFVGGSRWHGHELREAGFRAQLRELHPDYQVLDTYMNLETRQLTYEATLELLARHPELKGIYCAGGGMEGAIAALREEREPGEVTLVVNEWTSETRSALADGYVALVVGTPLGDLCREMVLAMGRNALDVEKDMPGQVFLDPKLYLAEFF